MSNQSGQTRGRCASQALLVDWNLSEKRFCSKHRNLKFTYCGGETDDTTSFRYHATFSAVKHVGKLHHATHSHKDGLEESGRCVTSEQPS